MVLPKDYKTLYKVINEMGGNAIIYASPDKLSVLKIYRCQREFEDEKFKAFRMISHPDCIKPFDAIWNASGHFAGVESNFIDGKSLPFLRGASMEDLIRASREIGNLVKNISEAGFLIPDPNPQNVMFSRSFKFVDIDEYLYLKRSITNIICKLVKLNMNMVNHAVLSGLIGLSYKQMILRYLSITSRDKDIFKKLKLSDETFVYDVLSLLQDLFKEDSIDEIKLQLMMPVKKM